MSIPPLGLIGGDPQLTELRGSPYVFQMIANTIQKS